MNSGSRGAGRGRFAQPVRVASVARNERRHNPRERHGVPGNRHGVREAFAGAKSCRWTMLLAVGNSRFVLRAAFHGAAHVRHFSHRRSVLRPGRRRSDRRNQEPYHRQDRQYASYQDLNLHRLRFACPVNSVERQRPARGVSVRKRPAALSLPLKPTLLQADRRGPEERAPPRRPGAVAKARPECEVLRRVEGRGKEKRPSAPNRSRVSVRPVINFRL